MPNRPPRRYWDSNVFIALIKDEEGRAPTTAAILDAAERGETEIVTSAFTLVEVIKTPDAATPLTEAEEALIRGYFEHEFLLAVPFGLAMAQDARQLIWRHNIRVPDAIHVVTALYAGADVLETYNARLHRLTGQEGISPLVVREPTLEGKVATGRGGGE